MWGQRLPGGGGSPPGLGGTPTRWGRTVLQSGPDGRGAAVVAVVWLECILLPEYEGRVTRALREIALTGRRGRAAGMGRCHPGLGGVSSTIDMATTPGRPVPRIKR